MNADNVQRSDAEEKALQDLRKAELDLQRAEGEVSEAEHEIEEAHRDHDVTINVDGTDHQVHRGKWIVRQLKAAVGVDPAKVLAEITPQGLKDLTDDQEIEVYQGERFMTHARSGGSSQ